jgi:hypothetical protein
MVHYVGFHGLFLDGEFPHQAAKFYVEDAQSELDDAVRVLFG